METEIEVIIEGMTTNQSITNTMCLTTFDTYLVGVIDHIYTYVKKNYGYDCSLKIRVNKIHDPSMVTLLTSELGKSLSSQIPFCIELGDMVSEPKNYDPIWV